MFYEVLIFGYLLYPGFGFSPAAQITPYIYDAITRLIYPFVNV